MKKLIIAIGITVFAAISLYEININHNNKLTVSNYKALAQMPGSACYWGCHRVQTLDVCVLCANPCIMMVGNEGIGDLDACWMENQQ